VTGREILYSLAFTAIGFLLARLYEIVRDRRRASAQRPTLRIILGGSSDPGEMVVVVRHIRGGPVRIQQIIAVQPDGTGHIAQPRSGTDPVLSFTNNPIVLYGMWRADAAAVRALRRESVFNLYCVPGDLVAGIQPDTDITIS
jgi:hypothetical protein